MEERERGERMNGGRMEEIRKEGNREGGWKR